MVDTITTTIPNPVEKEFKRFMKGVRGSTQVTSIHPDGSRKTKEEIAREVSSLTKINQKFR